MNKYDKLIDMLNKIADLNYIVTTLRWEMDTVAPKKSHDYLIEVSSKFELEAFKISTSDEYIDIINNLINSIEFEKMNDLQKKYIMDLKDEYEKFSRIPKDFYNDYCILRNNSLNAWVDAKEQNDYQIFKPYLEKIIKSTKELYAYMYPKCDNLYNCMLNDYEKGITTDIIDNLFDELKKEIIPLIKGLKNNNLNKLTKKCSDSELIQIANYILDYIGFDNKRGALGVYTHGYTTKLNNNDIRITFSNTENITDFLSTVIHEGGHGIFEQNIDSSLFDFKTYDINKTALHESQSRFMENILGRNKNFWIPIYDNIKNKLDIDISIDDFIKNFNIAKKSKIRTEADELTYCLHIIIRYEIEKEIFNGEVNLDDLPNLWNKKYKEYLDMDITSDKEGILQDMHWSEGAFGYFPSYLLGTIFDGMLLDTINKKIGNVDELLKDGKIKEITKYLNDSIHKYGGAYNINEVANRLCKSNLSVDAIIKYFKDKYEESRIKT